MTLATGGCTTATHRAKVAPLLHETGESLQRYEYTAPKMGTVFHMTFYAPDKATADRAADAAWARVDQLNSIFSDYDPNSELSKLGQRTLNGPMTEAVPVSDDLYRCLERSLEAAQQSEGAFDVTVGPLVNLWRRSRRLEILPTTQRVAEAKKSVGYQYLKLDPTHHAVQLLAAKMRLDVGGIAKGYTSTELIKLLRDRFGITRAPLRCGRRCCHRRAAPRKTRLDRRPRTTRRLSRLARRLRPTPQLRHLHLRRHRAIRHHRRHPLLPHHRPPNRLRTDQPNQRQRPRPRRHRSRLASRRRLHHGAGKRHGTHRTDAGSGSANYQN